MRHVILDMLEALHDFNMILNISKYSAHWNTVNRVLHVWKLHCTGWKTQSFTKLKISPVCVDGFRSFFQQIRTRLYAWNWFKIWFTCLTHYWENWWCFRAQCLLGHAVCWICKFPTQSVTVTLTYNIINSCVANTPTEKIGECVCRESNPWPACKVGHQLRSHRYTAVLLMYLYYG